jgi:3-oxoadipate enol-lactonase
MLRPIFPLVLFLSFVCIRAQTGNFNNQDLAKTVYMADILNLVRNAANIPSGAPPTNDGYAYSQLSYTNLTLAIAGQNGYDSCGRLIPQDYDYSMSFSHPMSRIYLAYLNLQSFLQCFNMDVEQVMETKVTFGNTWNDSRLTTAQRVSNFITWRSLVNKVQRLPRFWGQAPVMVREIEQVVGLSRGDTFEVLPLRIPRIHAYLPNCLDTGIAPPAAVDLLQWTLTGQPPALDDAILYSQTGYHLLQGLGNCSNPELRTDDWSVQGLPQAPLFGNAGDLLQAEPWNIALTQQLCIAAPARVDSVQSVPAANLFVRTEGLYVAGQPVFVLIHGTSANNDYWRCVQHLLSRRYFVVAIDLRGHGQSQVTPASVPSNGGFMYTYEAFANDIVAVLSHLGVTSNVYYAGISIGSSIGIQLAANYPNLISRLILVSGSPQFRCSDAPNTNCSDYVQKGGSTPLTLLPEDVLSGCDVSAARNKIAQNRAVSGVAVTSLLEYSQKTNQTNQLSQIKAATLVVCGTGDILLPNCVASGFLHDSILNSVYSKFVNRGHLLSITSYVDLSNLFLQFVRSDLLADVSKNLDTGCWEICPDVTVESPFTPCPNI